MPESINGKTVYNVDPQEFSEYMKQIAEIGVSYLGGCCGTTPAHIEAMINATRDIEPRVPVFKNETLVSSYSQTVDISQGVVIGERINPTGKKLLKEALRNNDIDYILREGISQKDAGAHILDVNMGLPEIDEAEMLCKSVFELQSVQVLFHNNRLDTKHRFRQFASYILQIPVGQHCILFFRLCFQASLRLA